MQDMLAARLHAIGEEMRLERVPVPAPRPTDVVVKVMACNVVPNLKNVLATYAEWFPYLPLPKLPAVFGLDSAGVVTEVGDQVTDVAVGDRVYVTPACPAGAAAPAGAARSPTATCTRSWGTSPSAPTGRSSSTPTPTAGSPSTSPPPSANLVKLPDTVSFEEGRPLRLPRYRLLRAEEGQGRPRQDRPGRRHQRHPRPRRPAQRPRYGRDQGFRGPAATPSCSRTSRPSPPTASRSSPSARQTSANGSREHNGGDGVDIVVDALGPGAPAETFQHAISTLARGGVAVDIGGMMERPALNLFEMMCSQQSVLGSLWFTTGEAPGDVRPRRVRRPGPLRPRAPRPSPWGGSTRRSTRGCPARHGGFTNFIAAPEHAQA